jgi:CheY-like chemotaxis protein
MSGKPVKTILIVDDEYSIVETLGEVVSMEGYDFTGAANGREALVAVRALPPALVLLDYMMPLMDGLQVLAALRADPALATIPVVIMTAAPLGIPAGQRLWDELLLKPFDAGQLMRVVYDLIGPP